MRFGEQVAGAGDDDEVAVTDDRLHDRAGVGREDLVAIAVQQEQGSRTERGTVLAAGGLRRERDDSRAVLAEHDAHLHRDRTAERMPDGHELLRAGARREVRGRGHVEHAPPEIVRLAVARPGSCRCPAPRAARRGRGRARRPDRAVRPSRRHPSRRRARPADRRARAA